MRPAALSSTLSLPPLPCPGRYADKLTTNEMDAGNTAMLTHDLLASMGIDVAGDRAKILTRFAAAPSAPALPVTQVGLSPPHPPTPPHTDLHDGLIPT